MSRSASTSVGVRVLRQGGLLVLGLAVGVLTGLIGTAAHLEVGEQWRWPAGLLLALGLVVAADATLAVATRSALALLGDATGRAAVLAVAIAPGPGGDVLLMGTWPSEVWSLLAVLLPALGAPLVTVWTTTSRVRAARRPVPVADPAPPADAPVPGRVGR